MRTKRELIKRYIMFLAGIIFNAFGVVFLTRPMLGTGPTSTIPLVASDIFNLSLGTCTFLFNVLLLLCQIIILRKNFKPYQLLQIPVTLAFSFCIDFAMYLTQHIIPSSYVMKIVFLLTGCVLRGLGVALSVTADVVMLSSEAFVKALADSLKKEFSICKLISDSIMTLIAVVVSILVLHRVDGVREGTLICVLLVGPISKFFSKHMGFARQYFSIDGEFIYEQKLKINESKRLVITITSLAGSGGRIIARLLGEALGIPVYDKELIDLVSEKGNFSKLFVKKHNEKVYSNIAESFLLENYSFDNQNFESYRDLFRTQSQVISELAQSQDCIIIGHCSNYVLKNSPYTINILITANPSSRLNYIAEKYNISKKQAAHKIKRQDRDTEEYYQHFTGLHYNDAGNYHLAINSSLLGYQGTVSLLKKLVRKYYFDVDKVKVIDEKNLLKQLWNKL